MKIAARVSCRRVRSCRHVVMSSCVVVLCVKLCVKQNVKSSYNIYHDMGYGIWDNISHYTIIVISATPVFQSLPKHDRIKPKDLSAMEVYQFVQQVSQFSNQHKIVLSQAWCLSDVQARDITILCWLRF